VTPLEETMTAFDRLVQAGKSGLSVRVTISRGGWNRRTGSARQTAGRNSAACSSATPIWRPKYGASFGAQVAANDDLIDYCRTNQNRFRLLAYSVLLGGAYTRADRPLPDQYAGPDSDARLACCAM